MSKKSVWIAFCVITAVLLALDLWLKSWAVANLDGQPPRVLIPGVLGLTYHENPGAFFGFLGNFGGARWLLAALKTVILVGLAWYYALLPRKRKMWFMRVPIILIFVGGLGNLVDRLFTGWLLESTGTGIVRDMLEFLFMRFAIFNLADVYVTVGVFSLLIVGLFIIKDIPVPWEKK